MTFDEIFVIHTALYVGIAIYKQFLSYLSEYIESNKYYTFFKDKLLQDEIILSIQPFFNCTLFGSPFEERHYKLRELKLL